MRILDNKIKQVPSDNTRSAASERQAEGSDCQQPPSAISDMLDETPTQNATANRTQPAPGPAGNGMLFDHAPGGISISIVLGPRPDIDNNHQPWYARMDVKCRDVPLLMCEGFHWTTANVVKEDGMIRDAHPLLPPLGVGLRRCTVTRYYTLRDLQKPPRWTACLRVHAAALEVLSGIRLETWTPDMIRDARAYGLQRALIYQYLEHRPNDNFNAIYDDMPLSGWWPWPKESR
ncbi:hypothetical protein GGR52DRAFT_155721 [Hypoxylon sp. FL1284]|nr:hypothetical protein GGR52DRAFT_155721 [Hypoxylon sp. FL1284]